MSAALDELDKLLLDLPWEDDGLLLSGVDGLIAGSLVLPPPPADEEWLPLIWGHDGQAFPGDPARSARLAALVSARKIAVIGELLTNDPGYQPLFDSDPLGGDLLWETWIDGFARATESREAAWRAVLDHPDQALRAAARMLERLIAVDRREKMPKRERERLTEEAPERIPELVTMLYRGLRGMTW